MNEALYTFAEVGVAIVGFSGIVAALDPAPFQSWPPPKRRLLVILLQTAALVVIFSLTPAIVQVLTGDGLLLWQVCGSLYALAHAIHILVLVRARSREVSRNLRNIRDRIYLLAVPILTMQIASIVVGEKAYIEFAYLLTLGWHVLGPAFAFGTLLLERFEQDAA